VILKSNILVIAVKSWPLKRLDWKGNIPVFHSTFSAIFMVAESVPTFPNNTSTC
jgi:hypothetical protein